MRCLIASSKYDWPSSLPERTVPLMHSVYSPPASEVRGWWLESTDWEACGIGVSRSKSGRYAPYPFARNVEDTLLRYLR